MSKNIENEVVETVETTETEEVKESKIKTLGGKIVGGIKTYGPKVVKGALLFGAGVFAGRSFLSKRSETEDDYCEVEEVTSPEPSDDADEA